MVLRTVDWARRLEGGKPRLSPRAAAVAQMAIGVASWVLVIGLVCYLI